MKTILKLGAVAAIGLSLSACGYSRGERAATGGLAGAAVGAAIGGDLTGAVVGGAVGAATGAATAPENNERRRDRGPYQN